MQKSSENSEHQNSQVLNKNVVIDDSPQTLNLDEQSHFNFTGEGENQINQEVRKFDLDIENDLILKECNQLLNDHILKFG